MIKHVPTWRGIFLAGILGVFTGTFFVRADGTNLAAPVAVEPDAATTAVPGAHLDYAPGKAPQFWSVALADTIMARWPDFTKAYFNGWTYVNG